MIYGFFGDLGSGKTLTMTKYLYYMHRAGYNIYSNYKLNFPHILVDKEFLEEIVKHDKILPGKNAFGLDEIDMYIDSRRSASEGNLLISYFIKQVRKKSIKLLYATQYKHSVDRRLRGLTRTEIICTSKLLKIPTENGVMEILLVYNKIYKGDKHLCTKRIVGNKWFDKYDTRELVTID